MALTANVLASGPGWRVQDVVCTFGPHDRPFAERHHGVCVAAVTEGTFQYRSTLGSAVLAPGALLLGNDHHAFECRH
jgi:AraC family transcriptional regulator